LTNTFKEDVKYQLSEYQKNNDIELSKAFSVKFEGNFSLKFIKIYLFFWQQIPNSNLTFFNVLSECAN